MIKTTYVCDLCHIEHDSNKIAVYFRLQGTDSHINEAYTHLCPNCILQIIELITCCKELRTGAKK